MKSDMDEIYASRYGTTALVPVTPMMYPWHPQGMPYHQHVDINSSSDITSEERLTSLQRYLELSGEINKKDAKKKTVGTGIPGGPGHMHSRQPSTRSSTGSGLRCWSRPVLLNNVALTFLLIAGLGLLAALSMGAFFALKPRLTKTTTTTVPAISGANNTIGPGELKESKEEPELAKLRLPEGVSGYESIDENRVVDGPLPQEPIRVIAYPTIPPKTPESEKKTPPAPKPTTTHLTRPTSTKRPSSTPRRPTSAAPSTTAPKFPGRKPTNRGRPRPPVVTTRPPRPSRRRTTTEPATTTTTTTPSTTKAPEEDNLVGAVDESAEGQEPDYTSDEQTHHKVLQDFGKVVGISFREGYLYVPSYQSGKISVLSTPDLKTIRTYDCPNCTIYDIAVLSSGDMVIARGRQQKLTKMDPLGNVVAEAPLNFATKGLAVSRTSDTLYVIPRSHDAIHVFSPALEHLRRIPIPNKRGGDCNFLTVNSTDALFVSCQDAVYVFDPRGDLFYLLEPPQGVSYAVGIASDESDNVMVVRRGQGVLDIFNSNGEFVEAVGENTETLWSDIAAGDGYLYAVDYIEAKIKVFRYL